jgi:hemerythrin-like domain-containing protein
MNNAIECLRREHDVILTVVELLEGVAGASKDGRVARDYVEAAIEFVRIYVDANHHAKEEYVLFVEMAADPRLSAIADALTHDHDDGRELVDEIECAVLDDRPAAGPILAYAAFIRNHIRRENEMIFPTIENAFGEETIAKLERRFQQIEDAVLGSNGVRRLLDPLEAAYAAAR